MLTPIEQQIYDLVKRRPRTKTELINEIWWVHPQDAPNPDNIKAHIWHMNQVLKPRGEQIRSTRGMHVEMPYELVTLESEYDFNDDLSKSIEVAYEAIRERKANGGPGW